jgi:hypothetical protein
VEATAVRKVTKRPGHGDAGPLVTAEAESLLLVAARTAWVVLARRHGVLAQKVIRVDFSGSNVAVVAADTKSLLVARSAELAVVTRDAFVALDEVRTMPCVVQPGRR